MNARALRTAKGMLCILLMLAGHPLSAQPSTEIYLAALSKQGNEWSLGKPANISNNPGYDNQPSFHAGKDLLLYARSRNGQTDIASYDPDSGLQDWITDTPGGSEYSPLEIPGGAGISSIRLDTTGLQRLYEYREGRSRVLLEELKVGYQVWAGEDLLVCTVLREDRMDLVVARPGFQMSNTYQRNVGRSLARIPKTERISYTSWEDGAWWVKSMDPLSGATDRIVRMPEDVQDICWLPDGSLICGAVDRLMRYDPKTENPWKVWHSLGDGFGRITRLSINATGNLLAMVVEKISEP